MASAELAEVTKSIRSAMGETSGTFRKASNDNNAVIGKIVKDLSRVFSQQKAQISGLNDNIEEVAQNTQQLVSRFDKFSSVLSETVTIQSQMLAELKKLTGGIYSLNDGINQLQNSVSGTNVTNSVTGWLGKIGAFLITDLPKILNLGAGAAALGFGAGLIGNETGLTGGGDYKMGPGETASGQKVVSGLMQRGFTKEESSAISGNISAESSFKTGVTNSIGAFGLMQWLGPRKQQLFEFAKSQNKDPSDLNLQLDFIKKELKGGGRETEAFKRAVSESGGDVSKLAYLFGKYVERPADWELAQSARKRQGVASSLYQAAGTSTSSADTSKTTTTPSGATPQNSAMSSTPKEESKPADAKPESHHEGSHPGIISGAKEEGPGVSSGSLPAGDIVALGKALKGQKFTITGHNSFPPVGRHTSQNSAHYKDMAIDVNIPGVGEEARSPEATDRFNKLADQLTASGYNVLWNTKGHYDHLHAQIGTEGVRGGFWKGGAGASAASSSGAAQSTQATPVSGSSGSTGMSGAGQQSSMSPETSSMISQLTGGVGISGITSAVQSLSSGGGMSGLLGQQGMSPEVFSGGIGHLIGGGLGVGGILEMLGPLMSSMSPQGESTTGQMLQSFGQNSESAKQLNKVAVTTEAQQQATTEKQLQTSKEKTKQDSSSSVSQNKQGTQIASDYNRTDDHSWPDWVFNTQYRGYRELNPIKTA
jgi:hypothetical protein